MDTNKALAELSERVHWLEKGMKERGREIEELNDRIYRLDRGDS
jgi:hypothetical protein